MSGNGGMMSLRRVVYLIHADLYRYDGKGTFACFVRNILANPGFRFTFWLRVRTFGLRGGRVRRFLLCWTWFMLRRYSIKYGISISPRMPLGPGLHIGHIGGIVVSEKSGIGANCNLSHDVTLGKKNRGARAGFPSVGDNVYIGPGAKVIGGVSLGDNCAVGANAVVTHDVPEYGVAVGVPAKIVSYEGSRGYVNCADYDCACDSNGEGVPVEEKNADGSDGK